MDLVARWWNGRTGSDRRDIWWTVTDTGWHVRARHGEREVHHTMSRASTRPAPWSTD